MNYEQIVNYVSKLSLAAVLILIIVGGSQGMWVFGQTYRDMVADRDTWKTLALQGTKVATQAAQRVTTGVGMAPPIPLPDDATPGDVAKRLDVVKAKISYKTEPTDLPQ